jgi:hypothetical protein
MTGSFNDGRVGFLFYAFSRESLCFRVNHLRPESRILNCPISASDVERSEDKGSSREGAAIDDVEQLRLPWRPRRFSWSSFCPSSDVEVVVLRFFGFTLLDFKLLGADLVEVAPGYHNPGETTVLVCS